MTLDLQEWKQRVATRFNTLWQDANRETVQHLYAFLSVSALWPVLEAAQRGDWGAVGTLAGLTAASLGTNLLANQIQGWKDKATVSREINQAARENPALRAELDLVLQQLNAISLAEKSLNEVDRAWFAETLKAELGQLKSGITYNSTVIGPGASAQGAGAVAVGPGGTYVGGDHIEHIYLGEPPKTGQPLLPAAALQAYLNNLIAEHQLLRLHGIRAGSQALSVSLEKVYVSLSIVDKQAGTKGSQPERIDSGNLSIADALNHHRRLVIIGDPGCGKTTLLSYIALTYARALLSKDAEMAEKLMGTRLRLQETDHLPILLPLRSLGRHLTEKHSNADADGPALLLNYLFDYFHNQVISLPRQIFDEALESGKATVLLDGMDEVADKASRQRIARLIEKFAVRYPKCRFVVTSREVGYEGVARIGAEFGLAKVRDFSPVEVRQFVRDWTRVVETTLAGSEAPEILRQAEAQANQLIQAIDTNPRVAELAVNPLLLTVIALVHRYRAQLPERRSELYEEAVEVLLGHWDEGKGLDAELQVAGVNMDSGDRRTLLEPVAFWMHEQRRREIELDELRALLEPAFRNLVDLPQKAVGAVEEFLRKISERSGLLIERGVGMYGFAHLTFQEYLAARELAGRKESVAYTVGKLPDAWWREVILLQAGYLSTQGKRRVSELIRAIMDADPKTEPEAHHHLLLAAECLFDVGNARVEGDLLGEARLRLQQQADAPLKKGDKPALLAKLAAMNALAKIESGKITSQFWKAPWGEPDWVPIPAGEFWMGSDRGVDDEKPAHKLHLPDYQIARVPITNAQYAMYVQDAKANPPNHWRSGGIPKGLENHPVVNVSWQDALAYCEWLGKKIDKPVTLPSEAEWEKAARGDQDQRAYPWGDKWQELHCNSNELGLDETTPVGLFLKGASPYGVLEMSGNVWEWTRSAAQKGYPYNPDDGREDINKKDAVRTVRGGAFNNLQLYARCAYRFGGDPNGGGRNDGFRVVVSPFFSR